MQTTKQNNSKKIWDSIYIFPIIYSTCFLCIKIRYCTKTERQLSDIRWRHNRNKWNGNRMIWNECTAFCSEVASHNFCTKTLFANFDPTFIISIRIFFSHVRNCLKFLLEIFPARPKLFEIVRNAPITNLRSKLEKKVFVRKLCECNLWFCWQLSVRAYIISSLKNIQSH